jgi:hypothetical protein
MNPNFDIALVDLGFSTFGDNDFFNFSLQREDQTDIVINLFRDNDAALLRMSAYTSNIVPFSISRRFFGEFARAALEPFRHGVGVGMTENSERLCVYFNLPVDDYIQGNSVIVLETLLQEVEKWDELLPLAGE